MKIPYRAVRREPAPDGGSTYEKPERFPRLSELLNLYEDTIKARGAMRSWKNIMKQYERQSYANEDGPPLPNFGTLRAKVDEKLTAYVDFATERDPWCRIETDYPGQPGEQILWSDHIQNAFHKYCIKNWKKSFSDILLASRDMLLFSKGAFAFLKKNCPYPETIPIEHVWPDRNAGMFPDSFDTLFLEWRYTAVELFRKVEYEEYAEGDDPIKGWRRDAVMRMLKSSSDQFKSHTHESIFRLFKTGEATSSQKDHIIDIVFAYVKEYRRQSTDDGEQEIGYKEGVSKYAFPVRGCIGERPKQGFKKSTPDDNADYQDYILYEPHSMECMDKVINLVAHKVCRNFYEDPSFAQLIYVTSKTYDMVMNRVLQAVEDNMRVYFRSSNPEAAKKLKRMRHGTVQVLDPDIRIEQDRIVRPIADAINSINIVMRDENIRQGQYATGEQGASKQQKTARQSEIDLTQSTKIEGADLKVYNQFHTLLACEIYERFTTLEDGDEEYQKNFEKFKAYLRKNNVPDNAWSYENVNVSSILVPGAGSPAYKLQSARIVREALSVPAASPGERMVQRRMISAAEGVDNVDAFLPPEQDFSIPEDSLIGMENETLSDENLNPKNVPVVSGQLHFRHIPSHIEDAKQSLGIAGNMLQNIQQFPEEDAGIYLKIVADIMIGIDHKLSHAKAHVDMASRGAPKDKLEQMKVWMGQMAQINTAQDKIEKVLGDAQNKRIEESRQRNGVDPKVEHTKIMYKLEEEHTAQMLAFDFQKSQMKAEQLRVQSEENTKVKQSMEVIQTNHKTALDNLKTAAKVHQDTITAVGKRDINRITAKPNGKNNSKA